MTPFVAALLVAAAFMAGALGILSLFSRFPADSFSDEAGDFHPTFDPERRD